MSNLAPTTTAEPCVSEPEKPTFQELPGRVTDLGGLPIRRLLPRSQRRLVGAWCFLDAYGPLSFAGKAMDVAPHPHIGLQTVSWLLEGEVEHHDSLGLAATAAPGTVNLMTAGRGIAHAEHTPRSNTGRLRGVQLWVALPHSARHGEPAFASHRELPAVELEGGRATVILGELDGARSPGRAFSPIVGADLELQPARTVVLPLERGFEHALVPLAGSCRLDDRPLRVDALYYLGCGRHELRITAGEEPVRALLIGGAPFGETVLMWWNFVARSHEEIAAARADWEAGRRFGEVVAYAGSRTPAPALLARPVPPAST